MGLPGLEKALTARKKEIGVWKAHTPKSPSNALTEAHSAPCGLARSVHKVYRPGTAPYFS
jgi:hypothetical protein